MNFNVLVKNIIGPTIERFDFYLSSEIEGLLIYENDLLIISIMYDYGMSCEVNISFQFNPYRESYVYGEMREFLSKEESSMRAVQFVSIDLIKEWIKEVRSFLEGQLEEIMHNHEAIRRKLEEIRRSRVDKYAYENAERFLVEDVDRLWMDRDYYGLVKLLKRNKDRISGSIKAKYEYALKMISQNQKE